MVENFDIIEKNVGDIKVIKVIGELDALVAPKLKERITKLVEMDTTKFIIDFEELVHINSLAMGILRGKLRVVKEIGGDIKLIKLNENIKTIFEMIGLDEIFEIYANIINYGNGYTGIKEASKGYFGEESDNLNLQQATMLAGLPQSPKRYNPTKYYDKAVARQKDVIAAMQKYGDIDYKEDYYILAERDFNLA